MNLEQGDIVIVDFNPSVGHEPAKSRPAIVVSGYGFNSRSSLVAVVPVTSGNNGYPLHIPVAGAEGVQGFACVEKLRTIDLDHRGCRFAGRANDETMRTIIGCIRGMLELR
ncbi:MAG: type II toxin-antitoxin system PemK/MazF family toxin [Gordonibacter sp.]|uniref:type II toxin-antitoxin system PemK/MazF family toxin n=1 Tax=Gordonibacter sp. TaxID=1968902 RepID=UPI002FCAF643